MVREEPPGELWVNDKVTVAHSTIEGDGLFARENLVAGTVVIRLAGRLVSSAELSEILASAHADRQAPYVDTITVYEEAHLVIPPGSIAHFGNHGCDPNMWHVGPYEIAARRDIRAGEELTIDYGTNSAATDFSMSCRCGSALCRGEISSNDWRNPELQDRYRGHWVPVLETRIRSW